MARDDLPDAFRVRWDHPAAAQPNLLHLALQSEHLHVDAVDNPRRTFAASRRGATARAVRPPSGAPRRSGDETGAFHRRQPLIASPSPSRNDVGRGSPIQSRVKKG
jgi:hypothetical protein